MQKILTTVFGLLLFSANVFAAPSLPTEQPADTATSNDSEQISEIEAEVNKCIALYDENDKYYKTYHWECLHKLAIELKDPAICSYNQKVLELPDPFRGSVMHNQITKCYWDYAVHYEDKAAHKQYFDKFIFPKCTNEYDISNLEGDNCAFEKLYPSYQGKRLFDFCAVFKDSKFRGQCNSDKDSVFKWKYEDCKNLIISSWQKTCYQSIDYNPPFIWGYLLATLAIVSLVLLILKRNTPFSYKKTILRITFYTSTHLAFAILLFPRLIRLSLLQAFFFPMEVFTSFEWINFALFILGIYAVFCWFMRKFKWWTLFLVLFLYYALILGYFLYLVMGAAYGVYR